MIALCVQKETSTSNSIEEVCHREIINYKSYLNLKLSFHLVHCFTNLFTFLSISFKMTLHQKILKYSEYSRHF